MDRTTSTTDVIGHPEVPGAAVVAGICKASDSVEDATERLSELLAGHQASLLVYVQHDRAQSERPRIIRVSMPDPSPPQLNPEELRDCPVVGHALQTLQPFEVLTTGYAGVSGATCEGLLNRLKRLDFAEILLVPVPDREVVHLFMVGLAKARFDGAGRKRLVDVIEQFVVGVLVGFDDTETQRQPNQRAGSAKLTPRETECLVWTARGKTSQEIAIIAGLSVHTVNHYLATASVKLGAVNRTQAVVRAMLADLFSFEDVSRY